jgi:hypothetical protein
VSISKKIKKKINKIYCNIVVNRKFYIKPTFKCIKKKLISCIIIYLFKSDVNVNINKDIIIVNNQYKNKKKFL